MLELTFQNLIGMTHSALIDQMIKFNIIYNTGCTIMRYKINQEILTFFSGNKMGSYYFGKRFVIRGSENRHKIQLIKVILHYITEHFHDYGTLHHVLCHILCIKNAPNATVATPVRSIKLPRDKCWAECGFSSAIKSGAVLDTLDLICR